MDTINERIQLVRDIMIDYDGCRTVESLGEGAVWKAIRLF